MFGKGKRGGSRSSRSLGDGSKVNMPRIRMRRRSRSMPRCGIARSVKGILKYASVDESLHAKYGKHAKDGGVPDSPRSIEFKEIQIREYARTVGDNPSCSSGPPVAISWEYNPELKTLSIDSYENSRPPRRDHFEMILPRQVRHAMLHKDWDVTQTQIASAVRTNIRIKNQRRSTVQNLDKAPKFEEFLETATRTMRRGIFLRKSTNAQVRELDRKFEEVQQARAQARLKEQMVEEYPQEEK